VTPRQDALLDATSTVAAATRHDELVITVHGRPKPKGSMRHVGNGRMVEQVAGSGDWRIDCKVGAMAAVAAAADPARYPLDGPVRVEATFTFPRPASAPKTRVTWPTTRASGDGVKLARNLGDALQDAGVVVDDARIIDWLICKRYPGQGPDALGIPGVVIRVIG
jgi:Holliday junction resolvase RusA-like endonuclease